MVVDRIGPRIKVLVQRQRLSVNPLKRVNRSETSKARIVVARAEVVQAEDRVDLLSVEEESVDVGSRPLQESPEGAVDVPGEHLTGRVGQRPRAAGTIYVEEGPLPGPGLGNESQAVNVQGIDDAGGCILLHDLGQRPVRIDQ